jgi:hypothetical protein
MRTTIFIFYKKQKPMKTILFFLLFFANTLVAQNNAIYGSVGIGDAFYFGKYPAPVYEMAYERRFNSHWSVGLECSYRANSALAVLTNEGLWVNGARQNAYYTASEENKTLALTGFYTFTPAKSKHVCKLGIGATYLRSELFYYSDFLADYTNPQSGQSPFQKTAENTADGRIIANFALQYEYKIWRNLSLGFCLNSKLLNTRYLVVTQRVQSNSPIGGNPVTTTVSTDYVGRIALNSALLRVGVHF